MNGTNENPILDQVTWYLKEHIQTALDEGAIEVVFQGVDVLQDIAVNAAIGGMETTLHSVQENLEGFAIESLRLKTMAVVSRCSEAFLRLIVAAFESDVINREYAVEKSLHGIATISITLHQLAKAGTIPNDYATMEAESKAYIQFGIVLSDLITRYRSLRDETLQKTYRSDLPVLFEKIRAHVRHVSEQIRDCDSLLAGSIARMIFDVNSFVSSLMEANEFADVREDLRTALVHLLFAPYFFLRASVEFDAGSRSVNDLTEMVAKTGIIASEKLHDENLLLDCVKCIHGMANEALQKTTERYGYAEPRIMVRMCYLGILALRRQWNAVIQQVKKDIEEFEAAYFEKYLARPPQGWTGEFDPQQNSFGGLPYPDQILRELAGWMNEFESERWSGVYNVLDDSRGAMYDIIRADDIENFIQAVWGSARG